MPYLNALTKRRSVYLALAVVLAAALLGPAAQAGSHSDHSHSHRHVPPAGIALSTDRTVTFFEGPRHEMGPQARLHEGSGRSHQIDRRAELFHTGREGGEATLGVTSDGTVYYIGAKMRDFPTPTMEVVRSRDDGRSWEVVWPTTEDEKTKYAYAVDPYLYVDPGTDRVFASGFPAGCALLALTDDGTNWLNDQPVCGPQDHETIFAGPPVTSTTDGYENVVYYCANVGARGNECLKSLDGGRTFLPVAGVPFPWGTGAPLECLGPTGHGVAGPDGTIYLPRIWCGAEPYLAVSRDEGATWEQIQVAADHPSVGSAMEAAPAPGLPPAPVHDAGVAVDRSGNIYVTWAGADRLPYLSISTDRGVTWSQPIVVAPEEVTQSWQPQIDVGEDGEIAIAYLGITQDIPVSLDPDAYAGARWNGYITRSKDVLKSDPRFLTAQVNQPGSPLLLGACGPGRCQGQWDYQDVVIDSEGTAWAIFMDQCGYDACTPTTLQGVGIFGEAVIARFEGRPRPGGD